MIFMSLERATSGAPATRNVKRPSSTARETLCEVVRSGGGAADAVVDECELAKDSALADALDHTAVACDVDGTARRPRDIRSPALALL